MKIDDLLNAVQNFNPTPEQIKDFNKRMDEWEMKFQEEDKRKQVTQEFLNKEYTI